MVKDLESKLESLKEYKKEYGLGSQGAYELIKDRAAREKYLWNSVHSYFEQLPIDSSYSLNSSDLEAVIAEIAFLSDWELGVPYES
mgnify:CR=1 FL=1